jgi:hypothetical protein
MGHPPVYNNPGNGGQVGRPPVYNNPNNGGPVSRPPVYNNPNNGGPVGRTPFNGNPRDGGQVGRTPFNGNPRNGAFEPRGGNRGGDVIRARGRVEIPHERFQARFGREHNFRMEHPMMVGGHPHFFRDGFRFGVVGPWPAAWLMSDAVYIDNIGGGYFLCNPRFPGVQVALSVADPNAASVPLAQPADPASDDQAQPTSDGSTIAAGQTMSQVIAALGYPKNVIDLGIKKVFLYNDMKLTFIAGRLSDVH